MKDTSNNDNTDGSMNHESADAIADADAVFPFSSSNLLPSSRMNMIVSTIVPLQRSSSTTSTASSSTSTSTSTSTSNDDANTSITSTNNISFMNDSTGSFVVYGSNNKKERTKLLPSSSFPVAAVAAAAHSSSTSSSSSSSSGNDAVIKSNDWTNMHIFPTEYIKSLFRSKTEYGGNNDTNNVDDADDDCSYCRKHL